MSYVLRLSPRAEQRLATQPEPLRSFIVSALRQLAQSPTSAARAASGATRGQAAEFKFDRSGVTVWVTVTFLYGADEQTLHVEHIATEFGD